jgi:hypothetical protein
MLKALLIERELKREAKAEEKVERVRVKKMEERDRLFLQTQ